MAILRFAPAIALAALFAAPASGEQTQDNLDDLVVKASRTPLARTRVGSAVSLVDRDLIEQRQSLLVTDILQDLPSINVSRAGGPGQQAQLRVRGAEANHLLVVIDGVEANDPSVGDEFSFEQLTAWDIQSIEVVRGPQSALWGGDAVAGIINVTTRRGDAPLRGSIRAEGGSFATSNIAGQFGTSSEAMSLDVSASRFATDGINVSAIVDENDGFTGSRDDGFENSTVSANWALRASDKLSFSLFGRYTDSSSDFDAIGADGFPVDADRRSDVQLGLLRGQMNFDAFDSRWQHQLLATLSDSRRENLADGELSDASTGRKTILAYQTSYDFLAAAGALRGVLAVDHEHEEYSQRFVSFTGADQGQSRNTTGYVAELLARPTAATDLSLSLRYDDHSNIRNKTTYRIAASHRLGGSSRLHASLGTGLKQPTFTELFGFFPDSFVGNPDLKPEESLGWDVGIEQSLFDERLVADLTVFSMTLEDEIQTVFLPSFQSSVANSDGTSRRQGVELDLRARLSDALTARASYTFTDAREARPAGEAKRREIRRPRHMAALNLNYRFLNQRANLNLNLSYTGEQNDDIFPPPFFSREAVPLDAYTLVNLSGSFDLLPGLRLFARAENLFDEEYQNVVGYRTPGTAVYAGVQLDLARR
jgi:vitamin B12 transporter